MDETEPEHSHSADNGEQPIVDSGHGHRGAKYALVSILALLVGLSPFLFNYLKVSRPVIEAIESDHRNNGIMVWAHFSNYLDTSTLVFDLRSMSGDNSRLDVFRVLNQSADRLQNSEFQTVVLSHRGTPKFMLDGVYFRELGKEYSSQNPVYTMRTFATHLSRMDGTKPFPEYTGGWLGVMKKEMEQFGQFSDEWFFTDMR
jgi:hypothetical protein